MTATQVTIWLVPLASAMSAVIAALLTIFLTPRLQHLFWKRQRWAELRLKVIDEIIGLTSKYLTKVIQDKNYRPDDGWFDLFHAAMAQMKILFSEETYRLFKNLEVMIGPGLGPQGGTIHGFVEARDVAFQAMFKEAYRGRL